MARRLEIRFPKTATVAVAELLDDRAPRTCDAIWAVLDRPAEGLVIHAAQSGQNVAFYSVSPINHAEDLPLENHQVRGRAGDIMYFYQPAGRLAGLESQAEWLNPTGEIHEILFSYGVSDLTGPAIAGWRGSCFAKIAENLEGFARVCHAMRIQGAQTMVITRFP
jgi:hypothetical protein